MRFSAKISKLTLNRGKLTKTFDENCKTLMRNAAREWVRAVYVKIPVWTGMARGAIKFAKGRSGESAGQFLGTYLRVAIPIGPTRDSDGGPIVIREDKSPEKGGRQSRYTFSANKGVYSFTFGTDVTHLIYNDFYEQAGDHVIPRPWNAFRIGNAAFNDYLKANAKKAVPNLKDFVKKTELDTR